MNATHRFTTVTLAIGMALCAPSAIAGGAVELDFDLDNFSTPLLIDNPYWPLPEGLHIVYIEAGEECIVNDFRVTAMVKSNYQGDYAGLSTRVISDQEWLDVDCDGGRDRLLEDTLDWYGQDDLGNIWYFGEYTTAYEYDDDGRLIGTSDEGSFEAGVDGAEAGLIMLADPQPGLSYAQEYYEDEAEDRGKVLRVGVSIETVLGTFDDCIVTKDWNPLEPGSVEHKVYCFGVGLVYIDELSGGPTVAVEAVEYNLP